VGRLDLRATAELNPNAANGSRHRDHREHRPGVVPSCDPVAPMPPMPSDLETGIDLPSGAARCFSTNQWSKQMDGDLVPLKSEASLEVLGFDYECLPPEVAHEIRETADRIKRCLRKHVAESLEIGRDLLAIKNQMAHGQFGAWLATEFSMSHRSANNYMRAAKEFSDKFAAAANLPLEGLILLAAPSTPEAVRDDVLKQSESGQWITKEKIRHLIADRRKQTRAEIIALGLDQNCAAVLELEHIPLPAPVQNMPPAGQIGPGGQYPGYVLPTELDDGVEPAIAPVTSFSEEVEDAERQNSEAAANGPDVADQLSMVPCWTSFANLMTGLCSGLGETCAAAVQEFLEEIAKQYVEGFRRGLLDHKAGKPIHEPPSGITGINLRGWDRAWILTERGSRSEQKLGRLAPDRQPETIADDVEAF
jgi:hypothetical protein